VPETGTKAKAAAKAEKVAATPSLAPPKAGPKKKKERIQCPAWKRRCSNAKCDYNYQRKGSSELRQCPVCGTARERCKRPTYLDRPSCPKHGGRSRGFSAQAPRLPGSAHGGPGFIPIEWDKHPDFQNRPVLSQFEIDRLKAYVEEDDRNLKIEFHLGRVMFQRAAARLHPGSDMLDYARFFGLLAVLTGMANSFDKRESDDGRRKQWDDPAFIAAMAERIKAARMNGAAEMLEWVAKTFDPTGQLGIMSNVPASLKRLASAAVPVEAEEASTVQS